MASTNIVQDSAKAAETAGDLIKVKHHLSSHEFVKSKNVYISVYFLR